MKQELADRQQEQRVGLLGGSFDPVHLGHLILAESAREHFGLRQVCFMPCADQPLKAGGPQADAESRLAMLEAATADHPAFRVLDLELQRGGTSYTIDSLRQLHRQHPRFVYYFLIGADKVGELARWKEIDSLAKLCRFGVFNRPQADAADPPALARNLQIEYAGASRQIQISSTEIRDRVCAGRSIRYLVPGRVEGIIAERGIYRYRAGVIEQRTSM